MLKNSDDNYFIEMILFRRFNDDKIKTKCIFEWLDFYPDDFLPKHSNDLFFLALKTDVIELAERLRDKGLEPQIRLEPKTEPL